MINTKLKNAFILIKKDILSLTNEIKNLKKNNQLSDEVKKQIKKIESFNLDRFTLDMKKELKSIEDLIDEFNSNYKDNKKELEILKQKIEINSPKLTQDALNELAEIINEKMTLEITSLKLEFTEEIARVYDKCSIEISNLKNQNKKLKNLK